MRCLYSDTLAVGGRNDQGDPIKVNYPRYVAYKNGVRLVEHSEGKVTVKFQDGYSIERKSDREYVFKEGSARLVYTVQKDGKSVHIDTKLHGPLKQDQAQRVIDKCLSLLWELQDQKYDRAVVDMIEELQKMKWNITGADSR